MLHVIVSEIQTGQLFQPPSHPYGCNGSKKYLHSPQGKNYFNNILLKFLSNICQTKDYFSELFLCLETLQTNMCTRQIILAQLMLTGGLGLCSPDCEITHPQREKNKTDYTNVK